MMAHTTDEVMKRALKRVGELENAIQLASSGPGIMPKGVLIRAAYAQDILALLMALQKDEVVPSRVVIAPTGAVITMHHQRSLPDDPELQFISIFMSAYGPFEELKPDAKIRTLEYLLARSKAEVKA